MIRYQAYNSYGNYTCNARYVGESWFHHHYHKNFELIHMLDGEMKLTIVDRDEIILHQGEYALILSNEIHAYQTITPGAKAWIGVFSADHVAEFNQLITGKQGTSTVFSCDAKVEAMLDAYMHDSFLDDSPQGVYMRKACLYSVCSQYLEANQELLPDNRRNDLSYRIIEIIAENYGNNITLHKIAEDLGYDYHYLSRYFHTAFRMNFTTFINQYRYDYAKYLLTHTDKSITEIAMQSGFQSIRNFNYVFKKYTGLSPREYCLQNNVIPSDSEE